MKQKIACLLLVLLSVSVLDVYSQNVGIGTVVPNNSAMLDITAVGKGLLVPRMERNVKTAIVNPPEGLLVYDSTVKRFEYYSSGWKTLQNNTDNYWTTSGGNIFRNTGSVGIGNVGATDPSALLHLSSASQGVLMPRMSETNRNNISTPASGLLIYNNNQKTINLFDGTQWQGLQYNFPKGTIVLSDSSNHTGLQNIGFTKSGYYKQDMVTINSGTLPAKTWYKTNQSEDENNSAPFWVTDALPYAHWYNSNYTVINADSIYRYNPATDTWTNALIINGPVSDNFSIINYTQVLCGSEVIMWNGLDQSGWKINLNTNTATAMSTVGCLSAREKFTAVWTGTQVLFWGGRYGGSYYAGGGAYNPSTNTWSVISNPPPFLFFFGRINHSAVWTGTDMIIWGGNVNVTKVVQCIYPNPFSPGYDTNYYYYDSVYHLGSGVKYNPSTGTYTLIANSPLSPRKGHSAVWTGTEMIIFGGDSIGAKRICANPNINTYFGSSLNSGAKYNPSTDTWTNLPITAGLLSRSFHQALWTGTKMIVMGKTGLSYIYSPSKVVDSYNPSTNQWITNDYPPAPVNLGPTNEDIRNVAVWAGDKIIAGYWIFSLDNAIKGYRPYAICDNPLPFTQHIDEIKTIYLYKKN
jgi:hypothetical protein